MKKEKTGLVLLALKRDLDTAIIFREYFIT